MAAIEVYTPQVAEMVSWFMRLMSRGNNVQRLDLVTRICALYKNPVLLLLTPSRRVYDIFFRTPKRDYFQWKFGKNV